MALNISTAEQTARSVGLIRMCERCCAEQDGGAARLSSRPPSVEKKISIGYLTQILGAWKAVLRSCFCVVLLSSASLACAQSTVSTKRSVSRDEFDSVASSVAARWEMSGNVFVDSALAPSYLGLAIRSGIWAPSLTRTRVAGLSVSELKSEKPYEKKNEGEIRRTIEGAYPNAPKPLQDQLLNIFMDADQRLYEVNQTLRGSKLDDQSLLKYAFVRVQVAQKIYDFEIDTRLAKSKELPQIVDEFDRYLSTIMIRGR
jgi:hypothetical protein